MYRVSVLDRATCGELVVIQRLLPHRAGEADGEFAAGSDVAEEGVCDGGTSLDARYQTSMMAGTCSAAQPRTSGGRKR